VGAGLGLPSVAAIFGLVWVLAAALASLASAASTVPPTIRAASIDEPQTWRTANTPAKAGHSFPAAHGRTNQEVDPPRPAPPLPSPFGPHLAAGYPLYADVAGDTQPRPALQPHLTQTTEFSRSAEQTNLGSPPTGGTTPGLQLPAIVRAFSQFTDANGNVPELGSSTDRQIDIDGATGFGTAPTLTDVRMLTNILTTDFAEPGDSFSVVFTGSMSANAAGMVLVTKMGHLV